MTRIESNAFILHDSTVFAQNINALFVLAFTGGVAYYAWYKKNVLDKVPVMFLVSVKSTNSCIDRASISRRL